MEAKIQKQLVDYFSFFDEFHSAVKTNLKDCQNLAATINKLIKRCKHIIEADVTGTPLENFEFLQSKLSASIHNLISNTVVEIRRKQSTLEDLYEKLFNKNKALQDTCREAKLDNTSTLVKGTPLQPPLEQLLEFASDTITFAAQACAQIESALNILSFKELDTISLGDHFWYPLNWNKRIKEITSYTSFITENQI